MVVKIDKHGNRYHEPPYTKAEEDEFYRRVGGSTDARKAPKSPKQQQPSPAKPRSAQ